MAMYFKVPVAMPIAHFVLTVASMALITSVVVSIVALIPTVAIATALATMR